MDQPTIKIGVSSCLLGARVRYNGGHKQEPYLTDTLSRFFEFVPVCPEVEIGMSVPREPIDLHGDIDNPRLIGQVSGVDYAGRMHAWADERLHGLADLDGYILKKKSPSCGKQGLPVYDAQGLARRSGVGIFARRLMQAFPLLPVEEESRLSDAAGRDNFIERVFAHRRLIDFVTKNPRPQDLVAFHTAHKLMLLSHGRVRYQALGRLVAQAGVAPLDKLLDDYARQFMAALIYHATPRKHADVLYHIIGYFKKRLAAEDRAKLIDNIEKYRIGSLSLLVPITLIKHHLERHPVEWLQQQVYLFPDPEEQKLRQLS